ncbi:MAG: hypothetical protein WEA77_11925 [Hyphomonas sp.]|uniref:hypothetical protein n=1 Tax=Hyphomonas sp. TaxID=87 RepID=UPI0034A06A46
MAFDAHAVPTDPETSAPILRVFGWALKDFDVDKGRLCARDDQRAGSALSKAMTPHA